MLAGERDMTGQSLFFRISSAAIFAACMAMAVLATHARASGTEYRILPSATNTSVEQYDKVHLAIKPDKANFNAPLVIFMPGTNGWGAKTAPMVRFASSRGYRAIGLTFVATPAIARVCPRDPDPDCAAKFREMRIYASGGFEHYQNNIADSVVGRLVSLLRYLDAQNPNENWSQYLDGDQPRWSRIVVSGQSQGAGMAAYIAKEQVVNRVVLFSPGWDTTEGRSRPAPWLSVPSATPMERWYSAFHRREKTVDLLESTHIALGVPESQITRFDRDLPKSFAARTKSKNPFHVIGMRDPAYSEYWTTMFGEPQEVTVTQ